MAYDTKDDKELKKVGTIVLADDKQRYEAIHVKIMKWKAGPPKIAITVEKTKYSAEDTKDTITTSKMPRLVAEDMKKINKRLPKLLKKAEVLLDEVS